MLLQIDKKLNTETKELVSEFIELQNKQYKNEFTFKGEEEIKHSNLEISLFILGYDIRMRILLIGRIAIAENSLDSYLIQNAYDNYSNHIRGNKETLKSLIQKYFKLQSIYQFNK